MYNCNKNKFPSNFPRPIEPGQGDTNKKTVFLKTNNGDSGKKVKSGRGREKKSWSKEERKILWECYLRSGERQSKGYMKRL